MSSEPLIAVFVDYENLALGVRDMKNGDFRIELVLKRLLEKGRIVFKRAYCDWGQYRGAVREFHTHGIQMIDIPRSKMSGKNSADIHMVVDAMDLCYSKQHIDLFALLSGDSDFSPLVSKLKENEKRVIGCGVKSSTSELLIAGCDEFIYYDDLARASRRATPHETPGKAEGRQASRGGGPAPGDRPVARQRLRSAVGLTRQADDSAGASGLQRESLRVPHVFRPARGRGRPRAHQAGRHDQVRGNYKVRLADE